VCRVPVPVQFTSRPCRTTCPSFGTVTVPLLLPMLFPQAGISSNGWRARKETPALGRQGLHQGVKGIDNFCTPSFWSCQVMQCKSNANALQVRGCRVPLPGLPQSHWRSPARGPAKAQWFQPASLSRVRCNQRLHIASYHDTGIFGAGAGPQGTLDLSAMSCQGMPLLTAKRPLKL